MTTEKKQEIFPFHILRIGNKPSHTHHHEKSMFGFYTDIIEYRTTNAKKLVKTKHKHNYCRSIQYPNQVIMQTKYRTSTKAYMEYDELNISSTDFTR